MKPIKEYINDSLIAGKETFEGLFDDEDDLLNSKKRFILEEIL